MKKTMFFKDISLIDLNLMSLKIDNDCSQKEKCVKNFVKSSFFSQYTSTRSKRIKFFVFCFVEFAEIFQHSQEIVIYD
jgi:hypothetical protein